MLIHGLTRTSVLLIAVLALSATGFAQIPLSGNVTDGAGGPLLTGNVYTVSNLFTVPTGGTLTVQPGAIVKFSGGAIISLRGTLNVTASAATPAIFTSILDDAAGGDTNGDGSATVPAPGDWNGILAQGDSDASTMTGLVMRYGGSSSNGMMNLSGSDLTLIDCTFDQSGSTALDLNSSSRPTVTGCTITNCVGGAVVEAVLQAVPGFTNNTATGNGADHIDLSLTFGLSETVVIDPVNVLGGALHCDTITIAAGGSVTLNAGVVLKFENNAFFDVSGTLTCNGTAGSPVVLTSEADDDFGGDSNGDGPSSGTPGDWNTLIFRSTALGSSLDNLVIRYTGSSSNAAIELNNVSLPITNVTVEHSATDGMDCGGVSAPTVSNCHFEDVAIAITNVSAEDIPNFSNNTAANCVGNYMSISTTSLSTSVTIQPQNILGGALVCLGSLTVQAGVTLTLEAGVVLKMAILSGLLDISGTLDVNGTSGNPVVVTTITDDVFGGDTNNDGGATMPTAGSWNSVIFRGSSDASVLESLVVRYSGGSSNAALDLISADIAITDCVIQFSGEGGLDCSASSAPTVTGCSFEDCTGVAVEGVTMERVPGFTSNVASGNAGDYIRVIGSTVNNPTVISTTNIIGGALVVAGTTTILAPTTLDAGVVWKFSTNSLVDVRSQFTTLGTTNNRVALTSFADDTFGGDTNKDGPSAGSVGDWNTVLFRSASTGSSLDVTTIRFAGSSSNGAVDVVGANITMNRCIIDSAGNSAVDLSSSGEGAITNCEFNNCLRPVSGINLTQLQGFRNNLASGNTLGDHFLVSGGITDTVTRIDRFNYPGDVFVVNTAISVSGTRTLTFGPGVIMKLDGAHLIDIFGTLNVLGTGFDPVVITSFEDDDIAGDTNLDGTATMPAPGDWSRLLIRSSATGFATNLHLRYGGSITATLQQQSANMRLRNLRVDHSGTDGVDLTGHLGAMENWVICDSASVGVDVNFSNSQFINATVVGNAAGGIDQGTFSGGTVHNTVAWNNTGGELLGYTVAEVFNCDADPAFAGSNGNISLDPQFVDEANGDFHLDAGSPCIGAADSVLAAALVTDHDDFSRLLDDDLDGLPFADMGAHERELYVTTVTGVPQLGTTMTFGADVTNGPGAFAILIVGVLDGATFVLPYGFISVGDIATILPANTIAMGESIIAPLPSDPQIAGFSFGVQAFALVNGNPLVGQITNRYTATLFE